MRCTRGVWWSFCLSLLSLALAGAVSGGGATAADTVDFSTEIQPLFRQLCIKCHGREARGGLRLDSRASAADGGDSGRSVLIGNLRGNELYRRITSTDEDVRMPAGGRRLTAGEIATVGRWLEQGAPWPGAAERSLAARLKGAYLGYIQPRQGVFLGLLIVLLLAVEVWKWLHRRGHPMTLGKLRHLSAALEWVRPSWLLVAALAVAALVYHEASADWKRRGRAAQFRTLVSEELVQMFQKFGSPPVPLRAGDAAGLSKTYFRGNCERDPRLFNGGNYLTAILNVSLCDAAEKPVEAGERLPERLFVRFEIVRAPRTADWFFSDRIMDEIFLSAGVEILAAAFPRDAVVFLETREEGQRWVALYPLPAAPVGAETWGGQVFVHQRMKDKGLKSFRAWLHFGIQYELKARDGVVEPGSDLWMGHLKVDPKVPDEEWLSAHPIVPITGENSSDPKLLGTQYYSEPEE